MLDILTEATYAAAESQAAEASSSSGSSSEQDMPLALAFDRVKVSLDILQGHILRNNPTASISPAAELGIIFVGCLADEMLYRAVVLTLFSFWLRDRFYEAGFDDDVILGNGQLVMATGDFAKVSAVAVTGLLGVLVFGLRAARELRMLRGMTVVATEEGKGKVGAAAASAAAVEVGVGAVADVRSCRLPAGCTR
jgi:hypothetical protein